MPFLFTQVLYILACLLIAGVILWGVGKWPGCDETVKVMIKIVVIVVVSILVIYLLFGLIAGLPPLPMRK